MAPRIPQEVVEMIIDWLQADQATNTLMRDIDCLRTLNQCALVCRAWAPRTRYHRLSTIWIYEEEDWTCWEKVFGMSRYSQLPRTMCYSLPPDPSHLSKLFDTLPQFRGLTCLWMERLIVGSVPIFDGSSLPLRKLHILGIYGDTMKDIWKFVCAFPLLEVLEFNYMDVSTRGVIIPSDGIMNFPPLTHVGVVGVSLDEILAEFIRSLASFPFARQLKALDVPIYWRDTDDVFLNDLLALCGSSLTRLSLDIQHDRE